MKFVDVYAVPTTVLPEDGIGKPIIDYYKFTNKISTEYIISVSPKITQIDVALLNEENIAYDYNMHEIIFQYPIQLFDYVRNTSKHNFDNINGSILLNANIGYITEEDYRKLVD